MAEPGLPPDSLSGFPEHRVAGEHRLARIHLAVNDPWWFSCDGSGRFDLETPGGTCYLAERPPGAFIEVFREIPVVAAADVDRRELSLVEVGRELRLADMTAPRTRRFRVKLAIHSMEDYSITHRWAAALTAEGFDGIRYYCSHDPSAREVAVALFGPAGEGRPPDWPDPVVRGPLPPELLDEVEERFGIVVVPAPGR